MLPDKYFFFFQAEDGIRDAQESRGLGDVYKRQCSMCLSAITFSGFDNFYYLFPYTATNEEFNIPHDLNILKEVFKINDGEYNKENSYWKSQNINLLIENLPTSKKENILNQLDEIKKRYQTFSNQYQDNKDGNSIPLN